MNRIGFVEEQCFQFGVKELWTIDKSKMRETRLLIRALSNQVYNVQASLSVSVPGQSLGRSSDRVLQ